MCDFTGFDNWSEWEQERYYDEATLDIISDGAFIWRCSCRFLAYYSNSELRKFAENCYFETAPKQIKCIEDIANKAFCFRLVFAEALSSGECRDLEARFFNAIEAHLTPHVDEKEG